MPIDCPISNAALETILNKRISEAQLRNVNDPTQFVAEYIATAQLIEIENAALQMVNQTTNPMSNAAASYAYLGHPAMMWQQYINMEELQSSEQGVRLWVTECYLRREEQKLGLIMFWSGKQKRDRKTASCDCSPARTLCASA